jgi:hypothetical protein
MVVLETCLRKHVLLCVRSINFQDFQSSRVPSSVIKPTINIESLNCPESTSFHKRSGDRLWIGAS